MVFTRNLELTLSLSYFCSDPPFCIVFEWSDRFRHFLAALLFTVLDILTNQLFDFEISLGSATDSEIVWYSSGQLSRSDLPQLLSDGASQRKMVLIGLPAILQSQTIANSG